jgi:acyl-CoA thioesterase-1
VHTFGRVTVLHVLLLSLLACLSLAAQVHVVNDGFPGENTTELDARIGDALQQFHPQYVVIFAGANDSLNDKKLLPIGLTTRNLDAMVRTVQTTGAKAVLVQVHTPDMVRLMSRHRIEDYRGIGPLQRLTMVNKSIANIARKDHAALVPFHEVLHNAGGANKDLSIDGVHLTAKGYRLLAQAVRNQLPSQIPADTTILCFGDSITYGIGVRPANDAPETPETYPSQLRTLLK